MNSERRHADGSEIGSLLVFGGKGMRLLYALYSATFIFLSISAGNVLRSWTETCALLILIGCGALVTSAGPYPLPLGRAVVTLVAISLCAAVVDFQLPTARQPGFAAWHFGAITFVLFALALRGRIVLAWIGMAAMCAVTATWSGLTSGTPLHGINLVYGQAASLFAGTFFAIVLRRTANRIHAFQQLERQRVKQEELRREGEREREAQLAKLLVFVEEPLIAIADGTATESDRRTFLLLEATLRDGIRGRSLQREPLSSAVHEARLRGSEVLLLDDLGDRSNEDIGLEAAEWVARRIGSERRNMTVRVSPDGDQRRLTFVVEGEMPQTFRLAGNGESPRV